MTNVIRNESQYDNALERVYELIQTKSARESSVGDELDLLITLIKVYEAVHRPMTASDPGSYLKNKMHQLGMKQTDLIPFIGNKTQVSRVLNHKQDLTLPVVKRLSKGLNIPIHRLVG